MDSMWSGATVAMLHTRVEKACTQRIPFRGMTPFRVDAPASSGDSKLSRSIQSPQHCTCHLKPTLSHLSSSCFSSQCTASADEASQHVHDHEATSAVGGLAPSRFCLETASRIRPDPAMQRNGLARLPCGAEEVQHRHFLLQSLATCRVLFRDMK